MSSRCVPAAVLMLLARAAFAMDIATCGVSVPSGEIGTLTADLACAPGDLHAVALEDRATLALNGHTISNPGGFGSGAAVRCFGHCAIDGPGTISGAPAREFDGIRADASIITHRSLRLDVHDVTVDATTIGIEGNVGRGAALRATNLTVTNSLLYGVYVPKVTAVELTATGNRIGVYAASLRATTLEASNNSSYGVYAVRRLRAEGLTATNNGEEGVRADRTLRLVDSTVVGNDAAGEGIDIEDGRAPRLENTTCGRSAMLEAPADDWNVCAGD